MFGGYNPDFDEAGGSENEDYPLFRELWRFHFATATWQQVRTEGYMPTELASMSGVDSFVDFGIILDGFGVIFVKLFLMCVWPPLHTSQSRVK